MRHSGQSGFRLIGQGPEAFAVRARSARLAGRSLDVQICIWRADLTGMYMAHRVLETADRGVQVRLLVVDMDARAKNAGFAGLDAHPRIAVRLFSIIDTPERRRKLAFTAETLPAHHLVVTRKPHRAIETLERFRRETVGTVQGTSWWKAASKLTDAASGASRRHSPPTSPPVGRATSTRSRHSGPRRDPRLSGGARLRTTRETRPPVVGTRGPRRRLRCPGFSPSRVWPWLC